MGKWMILNAGCGRIEPGTVPSGEAAGLSEKTVNLDVRAGVGENIRHDLNRLPLPFKSDSFDEVILCHVLEHLHDLHPFLCEIHRILKPGGVARITVPHYTDWTYWRDPDHRLHFNSFSFDRYQETCGHHFDTACPYRIEENRVCLQSIWRFLGFQFLVNLSIRVRPIRFIRKFWETHLCFLIRGVTVRLRMRALKNPRTPAVNE